jgi:hypothetical protein
VGKIFFVLTVLAFSFGNARASDPDLSKVVVDGIYYDWTTYHTDVRDEEKQCYMVSFAKRLGGNYKKERMPYISITIFKSKNAEEFSVFAGYDYKIGSAIYLGVDNKQFRLFTKGQNAWAKNSDEDGLIIRTLMGANSIKIKGETITGEYAIDDFELKGMARAYQKIRDICE